jgi:HopA1 effector protein family
MSRPLLMASELKEFLDTVWRDPKIMQAGEDIDLAKQVYELYRAKGSNRAASDANKYFLDIWDLGILYPIIKKGYLQGIKRKDGNKLTLEEVVKRCGPNQSLPVEWLKAFIFFKLGSEPDQRVYLNPVSVVEGLRHVCKYLYERTDHGIHFFKAVGPSAHQRADSIVVYCANKKEAEKLGGYMVDHGPRFKNDVPAMTSKLGAGVAIGQEPAQQATGLHTLEDSKAKDSRYESRQSFGTIRSQLIAMAICNYRANITAYGAGRDVFARFVCIAFRGYGLDPLHVSENASD